MLPPQGNARGVLTRKNKQRDEAFTVAHELLGAHQRAQTPWRLIR